MLTLLRREKTLQIRGMLALLMFAAFNIFWSALVLPLSAPPHNYSHTAIGALGLVGAIGALAAARAGHWADRGHGQRTSAAALSLLLLAWAPLALMQQSLAALLLGIVLLDLGGQALHVSNQSLIFRSRPEAHSRLVGLYMLFYALGSGGAQSAPPPSMPMPAGKPCVCSAPPSACWRCCSGGRRGGRCPRWRIDKEKASRETGLLACSGCRRLENPPKV